MLNKIAHSTSNNSPEAAIRKAEVTSVTDELFMLDDDTYHFEAIAAFSCLVKPIPGDIVLYAATGENENVIVSIVKRTHDEPVTVEFPQNANIRSRSGSLSFSSADSVSMSSKKINMMSETMIQKSDESYLSVRELTAYGEKLNANFSRIAVLSNFVSTMAKQVINKCVTYMRHSESFDQVKAENMTRSTNGLYSMNSEQTVMKSKKDTKIDAERIHLG